MNQDNGVQPHLVHEDYLDFAKIVDAHHAAVERSWTAWRTRFTQQHPHLSEADILELCNTFHIGFGTGRP